MDTASVGLARPGWRDDDGLSPLALRIDDIGAASKRYEIYSNWLWHKARLGIDANWLFLKYLPQFRAWGPYRELTAREWLVVYRMLEAQRASLTVAITAAWPRSEKELIPFPERFPEESSCLREGAEQGLIEIANHGLCHCVLEDNAFKPKWFTGNRRYHREFWDWVPLRVQEDHIRRAQDILQSWFRVPVQTFVPPGNVFTTATIEIASRYGLRYLSCTAPPPEAVPMTVVTGDSVDAFHDRDLVLNGVGWLRERLAAHTGRRLCTVRELARILENRRA